MRKAKNLMKDTNDYLPSTLEVIDFDLGQLEKYGDSDSQLNYLYFLRDEVNKRIKTENKNRKSN